MIGSLVAARLFAMLLRGRRDENVPYLALLVADLAALYFTRNAALPALTFAAEAAGVVLALAPVVLDLLETQFVRRDHARAALVLARVREVLVPGVASTTARRALEHAARAQAGDSDRAIASIEEELRGVEDPAVAGQLRGEIIRLLIAADRSTEAIARADRQLSGEDYFRSPQLTAAMSMALCSNARLAEGLQLLVLLERQAAGHEQALAPLLTSTRLAFIAGAGLQADLGALLAQRSLAGALSRKEIARLHAVVTDAAPSTPELHAIAHDLASRLLEVGQRTSAPLRHRAPVTISILFANVVVMGVVMALGLGDDELGLTRAGALYGAAVHAGEWWRMFSAMFLHAGMFHLAANMYALYQLGRATEEMLGSPRFAVVYFLSGLGGALASLWMDRGLSVGASGAIMGVLAALTATVFARRHHFAPATRRVLLGNLLFFGVLQIFLGWQVPMIDSAAHAGGFVVGVLATFGLAPSGDLGTVARRVVSAAAVGLVVLCAATIVLVARRPLQATLLELPAAPVEVGGLRLHAPRNWRLERADVLLDPALGLELHVEEVGGKLQLASPQAEDPRVRPLLARITSSAVAVAPSASPAP